MAGPTSLPGLASTGAAVVASIWGFTAEEFAAAAAMLRSACEHRRPGDGVDALVAVEANISCPNIEDRSRMFAHSPDGVRLAVGGAAGALAGTPAALGEAEPQRDRPACAWLGSRSTPAQLPSLLSTRSWAWPLTPPPAGLALAAAGGTVRPGHPSGRGPCRLRMPRRPSRTSRSSASAG